MKRITRSNSYNMELNIDKDTTLFKELSDLLKKHKYDINQHDINKFSINIDKIYKPECFVTNCVRSQHNETIFCEIHKDIELKFVDECCICFEKIINPCWYNKEDISSINSVVTLCFHWFHKKCFAKHLSSLEKRTKSYDTSANTCAVCRQDLRVLM